MPHKSVASIYIKRFLGLLKRRYIKRVDIYVQYGRGSAAKALIMANVYDTVEKVRQKLFPSTRANGFR